MSGDERERVHEFVEAAYKGSLRTVKKGLKRGVPVDALNREGMTAVMAAARKGHLKVAQYLVAQGRMYEPAARTSDTNRRRFWPRGRVMGYWRTGWLRCQTIDGGA